MKIIVLKNNLKEGLAAISRIGAESSSLPILKNFIIETQENKIKLAATNLEMAVTSYVSGKIVEAGGLTVPLAAFSAIISNIQSERINLETKEGALLIKTENYEAKIQGIKKEEFPIIPKIENTEEFLEFQNAALKEALILVSSAAQISDARPALNSVLMDFQIGFLKLAATDSFRLAEYTISEEYFKSNIERGFKKVIPLKTIQELIKIISEKEDEKTAMHFDKNQVFFKGEGFEIISRLINDEFPDYQPIIPKEINMEMTINREQLINALKLAGVFSDRLHEIKICAKKNEKNIEISSANALLGENKCLVPAKIKGGPAEIVFNWKFVLDGLRNLNSESVFFGLNNDNSPATLKPADDQNYFYILMPIKS